ncbi:MAG: hypothetical protein WDA27_11680 [Actinomycetota bacterium]
MRFKIGLPAAVALGFLGLGFLFILLGWNGSAGVNCVDCQIPYLISGGAAGLGFIILGAGLLLFEAGRRARGQLESKIDELVDAIRRNTERPADTEAPPAAAPAAPRRTAKTAASTNGNVVIGRSSFHRPGCRLVEGKEDLDHASKDEAIARGLQPCRVCDPTLASKN